MHLMDPESKRITLEHSYAVISDTFRMKCSEVEEEDSLNIHTEDFFKIKNGEIVVKEEVLEDLSIDYFNSPSAVKIEDDGIEIKEEVLGVVGVNDNLPNVNQQFENDCYPNRLKRDENNHCKYKSDSLELDECGVVSKKGLSFLKNKAFKVVSNENILKILNSFEKRVRSLKSENKKLKRLSDRLTKKNTRIIEARGKLKSEFETLKDKLAASKEKWDMHKRQRILRTNVYKLKERLSNKETQCIILRNKLAKQNREYSTQTSALIKLQADLLEKHLNDRMLKHNCEMEDLLAQLSEKKAELEKSEDRYLILANSLKERDKEFALQISATVRAQQDLRAKEEELKKTVKKKNSEVADLKAQLMRQEVQNNDSERKYLDVVDKLADLERKYANQMPAVVEVQEGLTK